GCVGGWRENAVGPMADPPYRPFDEPAARPHEPAPARPAASASPSGSPLIASLARACACSPLAEKVLIAPSLFVGHTIVERLAREGGAWTNLRAQSVRAAALGLLGPDLGP